MKSRYFFAASAAAFLITARAFAQDPQPQRPTAEANKQPAEQVTLVGCIQREADYRRAHDAGRGSAGTGLGLGNEFVLVNASRTSADRPSPSSADESCAAASTGDAYELTGSRERQLADFVGRRVEIMGTMKEAKITTPASTPTGTSGTTEPRPTGGFDPLKQDLRLFEVEVNSFRAVPAGQVAAVTPRAEPVSPAPTAAPAPPAATPEPAAAAPAPAPAPRELPSTASLNPLIGLIGLLLIAGAAGIRSARRT